MKKTLELEPGDKIVIQGHVRTVTQVRMNFEKRRYVIQLLTQPYLQHTVVAYDYNEWEVADPSEVDGALAPFRTPDPLPVTRLPLTPGGEMAELQADRHFSSRQGDLW